MNNETQISDAEHIAGHILTTLTNALDAIAQLYERHPDATTADLAALMYDARCIARTALAEVGC